MRGFLKKTLQDEVLCFQTTQVCLEKHAETSTFEKIFQPIETSSNLVPVAT